MLLPFLFFMLFITYSDGCVIMRIRVGVKKIDFASSEF